MSFATTLDAFCNQVEFTNRDIAAACGLSASALSRYRNGNRVPEPASGAVDNLAAGLAELSRISHATGADALQEDDVKAALRASITEKRLVGMDFNMRFDMVMHLLGIRNARMAEAAGVDPSYISRIRKGERKPAHMEPFLEPCARLIANVCLEEDKLEELEDLIGPTGIREGGDPNDADAPSTLAETVAVWLIGDHIFEADIGRMERFFAWLDTTDFAEWLAFPAQSANELQPPELPESVARFYYGTDGMRNAEIDFLNAAADTHARHMVFSTDMPLLEMQLDRQFLSRYRRGIVRLLEAGCHVNIIHNVERPLDEVIRVMRLWIPLYLTGQVTPYYLKGVHNRLFCHVNYACETCALASEAVMGHQEDGRYFFTTRPADVAYYRKKMGFVLDRTTTLLNVFRESEPAQAEAFRRIEASWRERATGRVIGAERYENLRVVSYAGDCTMISLLNQVTPVHIVVRHPKINYAVAHME